MNTTYAGKDQNKPSEFNHLMEPFALYGLDRSDWLDTIDARIERDPVEFNDRREEEFARMLDENQVFWKYKPRTFAVEWDEDGNFVDCFTPDFYLPARDLFIEVATNDSRISGEKARKVRLLRSAHPEIRIEVLSASGASMVRDLLWGIHS